MSGAAAIRTDELLVSAEARVLGHMVSSVKEDVGEMRNSLVGINDSLRVLAAIEARQVESAGAINRAFEEIRRVEFEARARDEELDKRVKPIEIALPQLVELRRWVIGGVLSGAGMIGLAMLSLVLRVPVH